MLAAMTAVMDELSLGLIHFSAHVTPSNMDFRTHPERFAFSHTPPEVGRP